MTTQLELAPEEVDVVRDVLSSAISDLSPEIADTDNPEYRRQLQARRGLLRAAAARPGPGAPGRWGGAEPDDAGGGDALGDEAAALHLLDEVPEVGEPGV